jgi:hypothetical protein
MWGYHFPSTTGFADDRIFGGRFDDVADEVQRQPRVI